jgi:hypothetical protein
MSPPPKPPRPTESSSSSTPLAVSCLVIFGGFSLTAVLTHSFRHNGRIRFLFVPRQVLGRHGNRFLQRLGSNISPPSKPSILKKENH